MAPRRTSAARALPAGDDRPELTEAVERVFAVAEAGGVRVTREQLREAMARLSAEGLRDAPASYARSLEWLRSLGLDPNDPSIYEPIYEGSADDVIRWLETGEGSPCGSSA